MGDERKIHSRRYEAVAVEVAVAVIWRRQAEIKAPDGSERGPFGVEVLLTRRPQDVHMGGLWEYPGGKFEPGESVEEAARREVREETGLILTAVEPLITVEHAYPDRLVRVHAVLAEAPPKAGAPSQADATVEAHPSTDARWVAPCDLHGTSMPPANGPITAAALDSLTNARKGV